MTILRAVWSYVVELVRELSDESAYARHLTRLQTSHSKQEWQRFQNCRLERKFRGGRCC
jgi:hypothetical protein